MYNPGVPPGGFPRMSKLLPAAALALALPAALQDPGRKKTEGVVRHRRLDTSVARIAERAEKDATVAWIIDSTGASAPLVEELGRLIVEHFDGLRASHAVVALRDRSETVLAPTRDLERVRSALSMLASKPEDVIKNPMRALRAVAEELPRAGSRVAVLFTLANHDNEDELEATARELKSLGIELHAIAPEAVYSDPYWEVGGRKDAEAQKKTKLGFRGQEAPRIEYPYGWPFLPEDVPYWAPSGFGTYGLSRLCALARGRYHFSPAAGAGPGFCVPFCALCGGKHRRCDATYDEGRLDRVSPSLESRDEHMRRASRDRLEKLVREIWDTLNAAGVCCGPPEEPDERGRDTAAQPGFGAWTKSIDMMGEIEAFRRNLSPQIEALGREIARLEEALPKLRERAAPRSVATAEALIVQMHVARFNLRQFLRFCDEVLRWRREDPPREGEFANDLRRRLRGRPIAFANILPRYCLCHETSRAPGTRPASELSPLQDAAFLGGAEAKKELEEVLGAARRFGPGNAGTPWEQVIRHNVLVVFEPVPDEKPRKEEPEPKKDKPKPASKEEGKPETRTPQAEGTPRPARPRTGGGSGADGGISTGR